MKYRTVVMANIRRKAANIFQNMKTKFVDTIYHSSGIRKKDKIKILAELHRKEKFILVSTQVVEAGVDISFSHVFREKAPLDSIIQVMGRLNREAENDNARLVVYEYDTEHRPDSYLELKESEQILKTVKDSPELYLSLARYYESVSERNEKYKKYTKELDTHIVKLDFDRIWDFIRDQVLSEDEQDLVLIPEAEQWEEIKELLMKKRLTNTN
jgi:CRISPR-associated endonuclease/helicase Cas3